jgi:hypothetical protein
MSARAILGPRGRFKVIEIDMPYYEREGVSKLNVVRDGFRFLRIFLESLFLYRPFRPLWVAGMVFLLIAVAAMASPVAYYWEHRSVQEWMIYRFIIGHLTATAALLAFSIAILTRLTVRIAVTQEYDRKSFNPLERAFLSPFFWLIPAFLLFTGTVLVLPKFGGSDLSGITNEHWSRFIAMSFCYLVAGILTCTRIVAYFLNLVATQLIHSRDARTPGAVTGSTSSSAHRAGSSPQDHGVFV